MKSATPFAYISCLAMLTALSACGAESTPPGGTAGTGGTAAPGSGGSGGGPVGGTGGSAMAGSGGTGGSGMAGSTNSTSFPATADEAGVTAYLAGGAYKNAPWHTDDTAGARDSDAFGHLEQVQVWMNDILVQSLDAGNGIAMPGMGMPATPPHPTNSMAVKEFYSGGAVVGRAVMLKLEGGFGQWLYYCAGTAERCLLSAPNTSSVEAPYAEVAGEATCSFCHGGQILTRQTVHNE